MLEAKLAHAEDQVDRTRASVRALLTTLSRLRASVHGGDLRQIRRALAESELTIGHIRDTISEISTYVDFDEEAYLSSPAFLTEVVQKAEESELKVYATGDDLFSYPNIIRVLPKERALVISGKKYFSLRPSALVALLKELQNQPVRFKPEVFLESLYAAYRLIAISQDPSAIQRALVVSLVQIYDVLTLLPGQSRHYSKQDFSRDIFLLDKSGTTRTKSGAKVSFPASTGTRSISDTFSTLSENGELKKYYGVAFRLQEEALV